LRIIVQNTLRKFAQFVVELCSLPRNFIEFALSYPQARGLADAPGSSASCSPGE